jgi:hypothetical protein
MFKCQQKARAHFQEEEESSYNRASLSVFFPFSFQDARKQNATAGSDRWLAAVQSKHNGAGSDPSARIHQGSKT